MQEHMFLCENNTLFNWSSFVPMFPLRITNMGIHMLGMWEQENISLEHSMFPNNGTQFLGKETWGSRVGDMWECYELPKMGMHIRKHVHGVPTWEHMWEHMFPMHSQLAHHHHIGATSLTYRHGCL